MSRGVADPKELAKMDESASLGFGEMDDINLPLDAIIERKAQRGRGSPTASRFPRGGRRGRRVFVSGHDRPPSHIGTGVFHGDMGMRGTWHNYEERMAMQPPPPPPVPQMEFEGAPYWQQQHQQQQMFPQPPPPPAQHDMHFRGYRNRQPHRGTGRGGIRKPVLDRRRGSGGRGRRPFRYGEPMPLEVPEYDQKPTEEEKCTMSFEKGNAIIRFSDIDILKVSSHGDLELTTGGHQDGRFLKALNSVLGLINVEILAEDEKPETWRVKDGYALFRYYDGIAIKGKGEPTKNRAESIKKAFEQPNPKALEATLASNLAARRLGLAFDPMTPGVVPGGPSIPSAGSIRITQDQQLTRTSKYSISFVEQNKERQEQTSYNPPTFPQPPPESMKHPSVNQGFRPY